MKPNETDNLIPDEAFSVVEKAVENCKKISGRNYSLADKQTMTPGGLANLQKGKKEIHSDNRSEIKMNDNFRDNST